jgi:beta-lactam-binding protein with PASTA domain
VAPRAAVALLAAAGLAGCGTSGSAGPTGHRTPAIVPGLVGQPLARADAELAQAGLRAQADIVRGRPPRNAVVAQDPRAGTRSHRGDTVRVSVSDGVAG